MLNEAYIRKNNKKNEKRIDSTDVSTTNGRVNFIHIDGPIESAQVKINYGTTSLIQNYWCIQQRSRQIVRPTTHHYTHGRCDPPTHWLTSFWLDHCATPFFLVQNRQFNSNSKRLRERIRSIRCQPPNSIVNDFSLWISCRNMWLNAEINNNHHSTRDFGSVLRIVTVVGSRYYGIHSLHSV